MDNTRTVICPEGLSTGNQYSVEKIHQNGGEYIADLPNLDSGRQVLLDQKAFNEIELCWEQEHTVLLQFGSGPVRSDDVLVPSFVRVICQEVD